MTLPHFVCTILVWYVSDYGEVSFKSLLPYRVSPLIFKEKRLFFCHFETHAGDKYLLCFFVFFSFFERLLYHVSHGSCTFIAAYRPFPVFVSRFIFLYCFSMLKRHRLHFFYEADGHSIRHYFFTHKGLCTVTLL